MFPLDEHVDHGFFVDKRWYPWGTLFAELVALYPDGVHTDPRWLDLPCASLGDVGAVDSSVHGPAPTRPVVTATYGLAAELASAAGLAALRALLDEAFGAGTHTAVDRLPGFPDSGRVRAASEWLVGGTRVSLSAYAAVRAERFGNVGGRLYLYRDELELAAPYLDDFRALRQAWTQSPGALESWATGAGDVRDFLDDEDERELALRCPHLCRSPAWLAAALVSGDVALWAHASGVWGIADRLTTIVLAAGEPLELRHERWLEGRGPGYAVLSWVDRGVVVSSSPGPAGLDELVDRLRQRADVTLASFEFVDA